MKERRKAYPIELKRKNSIKIAEILFDTEEFKKAKCVCTYMSAFGEVDTNEIILRCIEMQKKTAIPVTNEKTNTMSLSYIGKSFKKGAYGILEPTKYDMCSFDEPDLILVPGICFDKYGARIGFGKGYYDRFLMQTRGYKAGLCFEFQIVDKIESESHDIKMDAVICETGMYKMGG